MAYKQNREIFAFWRCSKRAAHLRYGPEREKYSHFYGKRPSFGRKIQRAPNLPGTVPLAIVPHGTGHCACADTPQLETLLASLNSNRVVVFVLGLGVGIALMAAVVARDRAAGQDLQDGELSAVRDEACRSLGYHHAEYVGPRWTCMDVEPGHEDAEGDEHEHDHDH